MGILSDANVTFPSTGLVVDMSDKFINLNENAINFANELLVDNAERGNQICQRFRSYFSFPNAETFVGLGLRNLSQVMQWLNSDINNLK